MLLCNPMTNMPNLNLSPGNTPLEPDELAQLIPNLATKGELDEWERKNIIEAHEWALNPRRVKARDPFTEPDLRELHRRMFNHTWKWAGTYRNTEKNIAVLVHEIRNRIPALLGNTRYWVDHQTFPADEIAIGFHHELVGVPPIPKRKRKTCSPSRRCRPGETRKARIYMGPGQHRGNWSCA
jgi:Fic-DOC domain mobile mystery protein B